jgi:hypothetical protein
MERVPHQGLPARTSWLGYRRRPEFATMVNRLVAAGTVTAPVAMSRDHLDAGSVAQPTRETENMLDGSDAVADWPVLNALVNTAAGGDLVALHQGGGSGGVGRPYGHHRRDRQHAGPAGQGAVHRSRHRRHPACGRWLRLLGGCRGREPPGRAMVQRQGDHA